jgi:hypothetical protein
LPYVAIAFEAMKCCVYAAASLLLAYTPLFGQQAAPHPQSHADSDRDGLSDALEQRLLNQFMPRFMVGAHDCSIRPAEFKPGIAIPDVEADNGTIYGQAFPSKDADDGPMLAELHYYHLWRKDCGGHGHPLDTEHVAVLVRASDTDLSSATWKAVYWYAAAHENTVCDVSQIARASTLHAEDHGATVWISPGKHASYLNETLCQRGCGADRCEHMTPLSPATASPAVINLGEPGSPMNGSLFIASAAWPLQAKMSASNFPPAPISRLEELPETDIAWFNPGRHPTQGVIAKSSATEQALANSSHDTVSAISVAGSSTGDAISTAGDSTNGAISTAGDSTGNALQKSYRKTRHALGASAKQVGKALHLDPETKDKETPQPR